MSCNCDNLCRVDDGSGNKSRRLAISPLIMSRRILLAPFVLLVTTPPDPPPPLPVVPPLPLLLPLLLLLLATGGDRLADEGVVLVGCGAL